MDRLSPLIDAQAPDLIDTGLFNRRVLLHTIAEVESGHGEYGQAIRHEAGYCYGSHLYRGPNGADLRAASQKWGCLAHSSFSSWQIMYIACREMGFDDGDPIALRNDFVALPWVVKYINRRILSKHPRITVENFADAYNSGRPDDDIIPAEYIAKFTHAYTKWLMVIDPPEILHT